MLDWLVKSSIKLITNYHNDLKKKKKFKSNTNTTAYSSINWKEKTQYFPTTLSPISVLKLVIKLHGTTSR